jgi:hypothetical protein
MKELPIAKAEQQNKTVWDIIQHSKNTHDPH